MSQASNNEHKLTLTSDSKGLRIFLFQKYKLKKYQFN